jgi:hypothetical protein
MELYEDILDVITGRIVALNRGSTMKAWMFTCRAAHIASLKYYDEIVRMANQPETMYKMRLISRDEMLSHPSCPLKYLNKIGPDHDKYTFDNMGKLRNNSLYKRELFRNTKASIILANRKRNAWLYLQICARNESFSFREFEILMTYKGALKYVIYFHTITSAIVAKYKSHFVDIMEDDDDGDMCFNYFSIGKNNTHLSLLTEVFRDHSDIFSQSTIQALLPLCRDFDLSKCDDPTQVINDANNFLSPDRCLSWNHIWVYIILNKDIVLYMLTCNKFVTPKVIDNFFEEYMPDPNITDPLFPIDEMRLDTLYYLITLGYYHNCDKDQFRRYLLKKKSMTWKFMHDWTALQK